jgi:hypothetical protein
LVTLAAYLAAAWLALPYPFIGSLAAGTATYWLVALFEPRAAALDSPAAASQIR